MQIGLPIAPTRIQRNTSLTFQIFRKAILVTIFAATAFSALAAEPTPAKKLFGAARLPSQDQAESLGFYAKGCLAGGVAIPMDGPTWQVLHPSRNRRWGNPAMISLVEKLSREASQNDGWPGLLLGDISQPRGGPMLSGHASHQIGLDADIWLTPMPNRSLSIAEREAFPENSVLRSDKLTVDSRKWSKAHARLIMRAASYPEVERIFVHPGIKKKLCETWGGNRALLSKVRPIWGHHYHFHIRMKCPPGSANCQHQTPPGNDSGCGKEVAQWLDRVKPRPPVKPKTPVKPRKPTYLTLAQLPNACQSVLRASPVTSAAAAEFMQTRMPVNAYVAPVKPATTESQTDESSAFIPTGDVPFPVPRPLN